jgi:hypothetical protein
MIAEGIRMKIALVFLVLIAAVVLGLPFSVTGDSSLTGAVQSFMSYGLATTSVLLGMLTIFMSRSVSDELVGRQIFLLVTKPIPRWEYVVGKWLGITLLNAAFLACAGLTIYGMVHQIKGRWFKGKVLTSSQQFDMAELNNEILVARHAGKAGLPNFMEDAELEFQKNLEGGLYADQPKFDPKEEKKRLAQKYEARWRVVGPGDGRVFEFENILCDRSPDNTIQLRYKANVSQYPPDEIYRAVWLFGDAYKGVPVYKVPTRHMQGRYHTIRVPADAVAPDYTLLVRFYNYNPYQDEAPWPNVIEFRSSEPVEVLFTVGSFGGNLFRLLLLMLCKLMFLAGVAMLAVTVFSFPVACLTAFTVYVLAGSRGFIIESLDLASVDKTNMFSSLREFGVQSIMFVFRGIYWVVPDFGRYDAVEDLVNGRNVSLVWVLQAVTELALLKTAIILGLAILFFYRREVAEISV